MPVENAHFDLFLHLEEPLILKDQEILGALQKSFRHFFLNLRIFNQ